MKNVISILLSFLIFYNTSGYILLYVKQLANNKSEMADRITSLHSDHEVLKLIFSKDEFETKLNWKNSDEFEYNGNMYDLIGRESKSENVIVYCLRDEREDELISGFEDLHQQNKTRDNIHSLSSSTLLGLHILAVQNDLNIFKNNSDVWNINPDVSNNYSSIFTKSEKPPPKQS